jgi:hypothetical protein
MDTTADKLLELVRTQELLRPHDLAPLGIPQVGPDGQCGVGNWSASDAGCTA